MKNKDAMTPALPHDQRTADAFTQLRTILVETSHPGNVGSTARALKTMGFHDLCLVNPKMPGIAHEPEAVALASGAMDVLQASSVEADLNAAVAGCTLVLGLTSRDREFGPPGLDWLEARERIVAQLSQGKRVALMFGPERTGLDNAHLALCSHRVWLEANPAYPSLNLAQAVMVCAYSLREGLIKVLGTAGADLALTLSPKDRADPAAVAAMLEHLRLGLESIGYLNPENPKKLMARLAALFARAELQTEEIDLLRGIAKQMLLRK
jgi:tRNA/rRNA methyltransferase